MNLVSYSIWGNDELYIVGALANISLVHRMYPGFTPRIYCAKDVAEVNISRLRDAGGEVIVVDTDLIDANRWVGLFWRFYALESPGIVLIRDTDSRITSREVAAVDDWLASQYDFHGMRDHIEHNVPIMGGMFGARNGILSNIKDMISTFWTTFDHKGCDQEFLGSVVWPLVKDISITHDRYTNGVVPPGYNEYVYDPVAFFGEHAIRPFPEHSRIVYGTYVGEIIRPR